MIGNFDDHSGGSAAQGPGEGSAGRAGHDKDGVGMRTTEKVFSTPAVTDQVGKMEAMQNGTGDLNSAW